ncbi:MAG: SEC-C metal-binding domain-containing protein [Polyangia bacterium]
MTAKPDKQESNEEVEAARRRLASTGRNDPCFCGSGKKYKKCHLAADEAAAVAPPQAPDPEEMLAEGWRLFEQRRPAAAEKEFRAALALKPDWADALVAIGLARLRSGDQEAARKEFNEVLRVSEKLAAELRESGAKDAFSRKDAQAYLRACHALGCLAFDHERYQDALLDLERVYSVDQGAVGTEARLIAGAALLKLKRPADAVPVLDVATQAEAGAGRALMSLGLAHYGAGDRAAAQAAVLRALDANSHFGTALLGRVPAQAANLGAATAGSREEAVGYAQTFGDAWDKDAKDFLKETMAGRSAKAGKAAGAADAPTE